MTEQKPSYYRARISAFHYFISNGGESKERNSPNELLKYGVIHPDIADEFEKYLTKLCAEYTFSELPLTFTELCSFNTWFAMHPEKIAGKEIITTSREFPIGIKGTKEDVIRVVGGTASKETNKNNQQNRIRIAKVKAQAKIKLLKLIK
jgi:hypothetical protein